MDPAAWRTRLAAARVATLATLDGQGRPHLVPVCFVCLDDDRIVSVVDDKPKRTAALRRLEHIEARPDVCLLAHHYEEDWAALWWVRVDGTAMVRDAPDPAMRRALAAKYEPYAARPPGGAAIVITPTRWRGWSAAG
jgi:PPOX class probable F420-dependent enzyme